MLDTVFVVVHALAGSVALASGVIAISSKLLDAQHKLHVRSGKAFFYAMLVLTVTAFGLVATRTNLPMLFVTVFSFYFAYAGWRFASNRRGTPTANDRYIAMGMVGFSAFMVAFGIFGILTGGVTAVILIVFGIIGVLNSRRAYAAYREGGVTGKARIAEHLNFMIGGFIATLTAFLVINTPRVVGEGNAALYIAAWLLPTIVFVPIMMIWEKKILAGVRRKGMPA